jgi:hypothetical protein
MIRSDSTPQPGNLNLAAGFAELGQDPEAYLHFSLGQIERARLLPENEVIAIGLYAISQPGESAPSREIRPGVQPLSAETTQLVGNALLGVVVKSLELSQASETGFTTLGQLADRTEARSNYPRFRYVQGRPQATETLEAGYLLSPTETGHEMGFFIDKRIIPVVKLAVSDVIVDGREWGSKRMSGPLPDDIARQFKMIARAESGHKDAELEQHIALLTYAAKMRKELAASRIVAQTKTIEEPVERETDKVRYVDFGQKAVAGVQPVRPLRKAS